MNNPQDKLPPGFTGSLRADSDAKLIIDRFARFCMVGEGYEHRNDFGYAAFMAGISAAQMPDADHEQRERALEMIQELHNCLCDTDGRTQDGSRTAVEDAIAIIGSLADAHARLGARMVLGEPENEAQRERDAEKGRAAAELRRTPREAPADPEKGGG